MRKARVGSKTKGMKTFGLCDLHEELTLVFLVQSKQ